MNTKRIATLGPAFAVAATLWFSGTAAAAPVGEVIAREENRSQEIGEQTKKIADELRAIIQQLENNRLLTNDENADFVAARQGMDEIARREVKKVVEKLVAARQALERARRRNELQETIQAQQRLISRLTEELVRIQYRSQLRNLLDQMSTIVNNQREAIRTTQNGAIEMAGTDSEPLRNEIRDRILKSQDEVWHNWLLVRQEVDVMVSRYAALPFIDTLRTFRDKASELPVDNRLATTRSHLRAGQFGFAISGQRELSTYFLELLKILQAVGLSPSEQRSALDELIDKTEQALRDQQDLRSKTETLGRDLTEPLREELAQAEDRLAGFVQDLAQEADQVIRPQEPAAAQSPSAPEEAGEAAKPTQAQQEENPWNENKAETAAEQTFEPTSPAARDLNNAAGKMTDAADQLNQNRLQPATQAQQQAVSNLAQALARMRDELEKAQRSDALDQLADLLNAQNEVLNELSEIIRDQEGLTAQTGRAAQSATQPQNPTQAKTAQQGAQQDKRSPSAEAGKGQPQAQEPSAASPQENPAAANQPAEGSETKQGTTPSASGQEKQQGQTAEQIGEQASEQGEKPSESRPGAPGESTPASAVPTPTQLAAEQQGLSDRTDAFSRKIALSPAAEDLTEAIDNMDQAASQLGRSKPAKALLPQNEALRSLRTAERKLAEAMAEALGATEPLDWLDQMENLDGMIGQIEQMAGKAAAMEPQPAPDMATQAQDIAGQLGSMAGTPPMGPAMAAQMQEGGQMMNAASGQLMEGQTGQAAQTMSQAAAGLRGLRGQMAGQMSAGLQQAAAAARAAAGQATSAQQLAAAASNQPAARPATRPGRGGKGQGMRGLGPTDFKSNRDIAVDLESGAWSLLPERDRKEILQALKERYPARYERALIRYYRNLSRLETER